MERIVISGFEVISCLGLDRRQFWRRLVDGEGGLGPITRFDPGTLAANVAGEIPGFDPEPLFGKQLDLLDRFAQLALYCARHALAAAGLDGGFEPWFVPERVGVITGSGLGGVESEDRAFQQIYGQNAARLHPFSIPRMMTNAASAHISMEAGARGPCLTLSTACASATHALGEAWRYLRDGIVDLVIAGGADAPITFGVFKAWEGMRVLAPANGNPRRACRPFSADRAGMSLAEGAAIFVLERESSARRRGAPILAELAGYGASADAGHITQPNRQGPLSAMRAALATAGVRPQEVDYINAHGTGTRLNDAIEIAAIRELLGEAAAQVSISSTKSMHGHAMGASGALELAAVVQAIGHQIVPPTANFTAPDPNCDLDVTPNQSRPRLIRTALSNSFAFGGLNAVLAVRAV